jgi:hypothetical protein
MSKDGLTDNSAAATCLKERKRCCGAFKETVDSATGKTTTSLANADPTVTAYSCNDALYDLQKSFEFECYANWPDRSMFEMRVNDPILFEIRQPNLMEFINSQVVNTFYAMNALVTMHSA